MPAAGRSIIGFKKPLYKFRQTDLMGEFFEKEKASIGRKISAIEIDFKFSVAFK